MFTSYAVVDINDVSIKNFYIERARTWDYKLYCYPKFYKYMLFRSLTSKLWVLLFNLDWLA